jgi:hypothetical protein
MGNGEPARRALAASFITLQLARIAPRRSARRRRPTIRCCASPGRAAMRCPIGNAWRIQSGGVRASPVVNERRMLPLESATICP